MTEKTLNQQLIDKLGCTEADISENALSMIASGLKEKACETIRKNMRRRLRYQLMLQLSAWVYGEKNAMFDAFMEKHIEQTRRTAGNANTNDTTTGTNNTTSVHPRSGRQP